MSVDILMATYNGGEYLAEQLDSLIEQTYTDWRLFVSDDGSTDETLEVLRAYETRDPRITVVSTNAGNGSAQANFWSLLPYAESDRIMLCDQDDVWFPSKITTELAEMDRLQDRYGDDEPLVVFSDMQVAAEDLTIIGESYERYRKVYPPRLRFPNMLMLNYAAGCSMMFNKRTRDVALRTTDLEDMMMHDWWILLIAVAFGHASYIDEPLLLYRQHTNNACGVQKRSNLAMPHASNVQEKVEAHLRQARAFERTYGSDLDKANARTLSELLKSSSGGPEGLLHLFSSGCWKNGIRRKLGQIYATMFLLKADRFDSADAEAKEK